MVEWCALLSRSKCSYWGYFKYSFLNCLYAVQKVGLWHELTCDIKGFALLLKKQNPANPFLYSIQSQLSWGLKVINYLDIWVVLKCHLIHGLVNIFHFTFCCSFKDDLLNLFKIILVKIQNSLFSVNAQVSKNSSFKFFHFSLLASKTTSFLQCC